MPEDVVAVGSASVVCSGIISFSYRLLFAASPVAQGKRAATPMSKSRSLVETVVGVDLAP
jgi:hypothetical protein